MSIGLGLFAIMLGAILKFAVTAQGGRHQPGDRWRDPDGGRRDRPDRQRVDDHVRSRGGRGLIARAGALVSASALRSGPPSAPLRPFAVHQSRRMIWIAAALGMASRTPRIPSSCAPTSRLTIVTSGFAWSRSAVHKRLHDVVLKPLPNDDERNPHDRGGREAHRDGGQRHDNRSERRAD